MAKMPRVTRESGARGMARCVWRLRAAKQASVEEPSGGRPSSKS